MQRGPDKPRLGELEKWLKHAAAHVIRGQEAAQLVAEGAEEIGMKWIEVDKNETVRVETKQTGGVEHVLVKLKSRLVALGRGQRQSDSRVQFPEPSKRRRCSEETWRARTSWARACPVSCCSGSHEQDCQASTQATACWHAYMCTERRMQGDGSG